MAYRITFGFFLSGLVIQGLKITFRIPRPWVLDPLFEPVESAIEGATGYSFPSGHTAAAFAGASFIHKRYGLKQALLPYVLASFVGYSRIQAKKHYWYDVLAGASIAIGYTWLFVDEKMSTTFSADTKSVRFSFTKVF